MIRSTLPNNTSFAPSAAAPAAQNQNTKSPHEANDSSAMVTDVDDTVSVDPRVDSILRFTEEGRAELEKSMLLPPSTRRVRLEAKGLTAPNLIPTGRGLRVTGWEGPTEQGRESVDYLVMRDGKLTVKSLPDPQLMENAKVYTYEVEGVDGSNGVKAIAGVSATAALAYVLKLKEIHGEDAIAELSKQIAVDNESDVDLKGVHLHFGLHPKRNLPGDDSEGMVMMLPGMGAVRVSGGEEKGPAHGGVIDRDLGVAMDTAAHRRKMTEFGTPETIALKNCLTLGVAIDAHEGEEGVYTEPVARAWSTWELPSANEPHPPARYDLFDDDGLVASTELENYVEKGERVTLDAGVVKSISGDVQTQIVPDGGERLRVTTALQLHNDSVSMRRANVMFDLSGFEEVTAAQLVVNGGKSSRPGIASGAVELPVDILPGDQPVVVELTFKARPARDDVEMASAPAPKSMYQ